MVFNSRSKAAMSSKETTNSCLNIPTRKPNVKDDTKVKAVEADDRRDVTIAKLKRAVLVLSTLSLSFYFLFMVFLLAFFFREGSRPDCSKLPWSVWSSFQTGNSLVLKHISHDGDGGYPGQVTSYVTYEMTNEKEVIVKMNATTSKATPINLVSNLYFNLAGEATGAIYDHVISIHADQYQSENGTLTPVVGTPFNLLRPVRLGDVIHKTHNSGFNNHFILNGTFGMKYASRVFDPNSGRVLDTYTNQPSLYLSTGNQLEGTVGIKGGLMYGKHGAFSLTTGNYASSLNDSTHLKTTILQPGSTYQHVTIYKFSRPPQPND